MNRRRLVGLCALAVVALVLPASAARAALVLPPGSARLQTLGADGQPDSRAGIHPDRFVQTFELVQSGGVEEEPKEISVLFPPGLSGSAEATPFCPRAEIEELFGGCPADSQVGTLSAGSESIPIYNLVPGPSEAISLAAEPGLPVFLSGKLRAADQGLTLTIPRIDPYGGESSFSGGTIELWGVPADHQEGGEPIPRRALLTTPTRCGASLVSTIEVHTWQNPGTAVTGSADSGMPLTGCAELPFDPSVSFEVDHPNADSPTGTRIGISMPPEAADPSARVQSQIESLRLEFPPGMTISLGAAAGIVACGDAQFGFGSEVEATCPPASKIGSIEMGLASSSKPLKGSIYLGQEHPGERFRLFVVASGSGTTLKFIGALKVDPTSGQISAELRNLPQASFETMTLRLDGGPGALLATPLSCGASGATATLTPYSGAAAARREAKVSFAPIGGGACAGPKLPFAPGFQGGSTDNRAGAATSFTTTVSRADGEGLASRVEMPLPEGMSANLGEVPLCSAAAANAASCPAASRIGGAVAELGPGTPPATVNGDIYLTGPYRHSPFGLAIAFGAAIGPFDLGQIVVRGAMRIDPLTSRVEVVTDPLPSSIEGIPVRFREIGLDLDRKGFLHNPTGCSARRLTATLLSAEGTAAKVSTPFAIRGCVDLPFKPRFSLALEDRSQLHPQGRPGLQIAAKVPPGGANLRSSKITLPPLLGFTSKGALELCAHGAAMEGHCAKSSRVGTASGRTPLLKKPMKGFVYSVQPKGKGSPQIWVDLHGAGIEVELRGSTATVHGHAVTTLAGIPDFPLSSFQMDLQGGKHGPLVLAGNPCAHRLRAPLQLIGHNAAERRSSVAIAVPCKRHG